MNKLMILLCLICVVSCKKAEVAQPVPAITINTPVSNQHFVTGDTIRISGTIISSIEMPQASVHITDMSTKDEFFHNHFIPANPFNLNYEFKYKIIDNAKKTYQIEVEAGDKNGGTDKKEIMISIN